MDNNIPTASHRFNIHSHRGAAYLLHLDNSTFSCFHNLASCEWVISFLRLDIDSTSILIAGLENKVTKQSALASGHSLCDTYTFLQLTFNYIAIKLLDSTDSKCMIHASIKHASQEK